MNPSPYIEFTVKFPLDFTVGELLPQDQIDFQKSIRSTFLSLAMSAGDNFIARNSNTIVLYGQQAAYVKNLVDNGFYNMLTYRILRHDPAFPVNIPFGNGGKVVTSFGTDIDRAASIAIQADGKVVAAGFTHTGNTQFDFALARYNYDGSLDATFGIGGKVVTDFGTNDDKAQGVAIQADGKVVAAGLTHTGNTQFNFATTRYNTDGSLDATFGTGGKVVTSFGTDNDQAFGVAIQSDGKIVLTGITHTDNTQFNFGSVRYNIDGSLDISFNHGGRVITSFGTDHDQALSIAIQRDGKIVVGGYTHTGNTKFDFALARYHPNGSLDAY